MLKLAGSLCILAGGALAWQTRMAAHRRQRDTLYDLLHALRRMGEEIRMARTSLPRLLDALAADCRSSDTAALFRSTAQAARDGGDLWEVWRRKAENLPLIQRDREMMRELELRGDEENVCKGISIVICRLERSVMEWERTGPEETKRTTALCFSGAALLVILLL